MTTLQERCRGCLLGLACGDAVGTTVEFSPPGTFPPVEDMVGDGPFRLQAGEWTDDTSMALCLAASLVENRGFDPVDQLQRYVRWRREGYMSCTGRCFDIGSTVREALLRFEETGQPYCGSTDPYSAGNGSLMRLAPVPMFFAGDPARAIERAGDCSRTTHAAPAAVDACRYFAGLIVGALSGVSKEELLAPRYCPVSGLWARQPLVPEIDEIAAGSFKEREPPKIEGSGYVVRCLEAALWAFHRSETFRNGCLMAVNLGDDADTTAAVYGQIAGAFYGQKGLPGRWVLLLAMVEEIAGWADQLYELSQETLA
jgi:ADP-ribosylglycohydrolase